MKFRVVFIPMLFFLNSFTSANALSSNEATVINAMYQSLVASTDNFTSSSKATAAINSTIISINSDKNISKVEKNNALLLILSKLKQTNIDTSTLNAAIIASNTPTPVKAALLNIIKDTPDGAKPIPNSP